MEGFHRGIFAVGYMGGGIVCLSIQPAKTCAFPCVQTIRHRKVTEKTLMIGGLGGELAERRLPPERQDVASGSRGSVVRAWAGNTLPGKSEVRAGAK